MLAELTSAASSVKVMAELLVLIHKTKVSDAVEMKAVELNTLVISFQSECFSLLSKNQELLNEKDDLKRKIVEMENWKEEAAKYEMLSPYRGVTVYAPKREVQGSEPFHWICPDCYNHQRKSLIQRESIRLGVDVTYTCFSCSFKVVMRGVHEIKREETN